MQVNTKSWKLTSRNPRTNHLLNHLGRLKEKWRGWDLRALFAKSWELSEQESQNQSSFNSLRQVKRKMARLGFEPRTNGL